MRSHSPHRRNRASAPLMALLLASTALVGFTSARAQELPTGGSVASGGVTISNPSSSQLSIKQSTNSAIVNWQSFSIGAGATVNIDQPSSSATMLNRVTGGTKSTISGQLNANGQVFLVNPNGIAISKTGKVSAAGFVASSLDISDDDFKAGKLTFQGKGASAAVSNQGSISIGRGGYAALIGGSVDNAGSISVPLGKVGLGSGEKATLDLSGDGFLQVSVPTKADGGNALVSNSGTISADGGTVELKAAAVRDAARQAVNMSGVVEARTVSGKSGAIVLGGGDGSVEISGKLDASAKAGGKGGKVTVTGRKLKLKAAKVDASGKDCGGTVKIGGDKQGSGTLQRAATTEIDAATTINADATGTGDGGTVIVWSDEQTKFAGKISAQGGADGGNGGFTEVSGKQRLDFTGSVDLRARFGDTGDLLLDPYNVTISNGSDTGGFTASSNDSVINVATLQNQLALANVTISTGSGGAQAGDITIAAPISWSANTLTLSAYHSIVFNAGATIGGVGGLSLITNNGGSGGTISYALGAAVTFTGTQGAQALSINGQSYTLIYDVNGLQNINTGLTGRYALANTIDATVTYNWNGPKGFIPIGTDGNTNILNGGNGFNGTFDGLGNTINYLWSTPGGANYAGLFGYIGGGGAVRNVGLVDAVVMASYETGAIAGWNKGSISGVWASGQIHGASATGGLVGQNDGSITLSFSTVGVNARDYNSAGGLVGANTASGTISQSYSTGWVLGSSFVGGFAGLNQGSISDSYSTGPASGINGGTQVGGFVGVNFGTVANGAFDTMTSGLTNAFGSGSSLGSVIGLATSDFQNGAANGLSAAFGGGSGGLYPYLKSFYPNGVQAISGIAYKDSGVTPLSSDTRQPYYVKNPGLVTAVANGIDLGTVSTGVNGYYYIATPNGTIGSAVLVYTVQDGGPDASGAQNGVTFRTGLSGGNVSNLNVYGNWRLDEADSSITSLSALQDAATATVGSTYVGSLTFANWQIETAATTFAIDQLVSIGAGTLALSSNGTVTQTYGLAAASLVLGGSGDFALGNGGNQIGTIAGNAGSISLYDQGGLAVGTVSGARGVTTAGVTATGQVQLQTTGDLTIAAGAKVSGTDPVLAAGGKFINSRGSDAVTATSGRWLVYAAAPTGNTFGNLNSGNTAVWNTAAGATVGVSGNRYVFAYQPTLTFTSENASKIYGDTAMPTLTYTVSGYQAGVTNAYLGDSANTAFTGAPSLSTPNTLATMQLGAGTYTITVGAGDIAALTGYGLAFNSAGLFTVAKRAVTVTADPGQQKTYGDADPAAYTYTVSDLGNGVALAGSLNRDAGENAGTYAIGQGTLTNANNTNYDIAYVGANFTIDKRAITVTADQGQSKVYGDSDPAAYTYSVSNLGGLSLTGSLDRVAGENAGTYAIGQGTLNVANSNYDITFVGADFSIGKRAVTVTANSGLGKFYGDADPSSYGYTYSDLGTGVALVGALDRDSGENVGSYAIGQGTLTNADNSNYDISFVSKDFSIGKRAVTVTANSGQGKTYGDADPSSYGYTYSDLGTGVALVGALDRASGENVGSYAIGQGTLTNADNSNYDITFVSKDFSIGKRAVTVTANSGQGKTYGNANPTLGYSYTDLGSGAALVGALDRASGEDVGTYAIGQGSLTTADNANYDITFVGSTFSIGKRAVIVTATSGQGKTYGNADPSSYAYSYSDLGSGAALVGALDRASGEDVGSYALGQGSLTNANNSNYDITYVGSNFSIGKRAVTVTATSGQGKTYGNADPSAYGYSYSNLGTGVALVGALDRAGGENAGTYAIGQGTLSDANNANYDISFVSNDFTIARRAVTVTANSGQGKTYGDADPSSYGYTYLDLGTGVALVGTLDRAAGENVGAYAIGQGSLTNANNANYDITFASADFAIGKRAVTVTANAGQGKTYGDADPSLGYTFSDLGSGTALVGALDRGAGENVGIYAIGQGTITNAANANYDITYVGANFAIGKRAVTVTANTGQGKIYGNADPTLGYTFSDLGSGTALVGALDRASGENVGIYAVSQGTITNTANANYDITYAGADFTIGKRSITVVADAQSRLQGSTNPPLTYTIGGLGLVGSDTLAGSLSTDATTASAPGTYAIEQGSLAASANYDLTYVGADLVVQPSSAAPSADTASVVAYSAASHGGGQPVPVFFTGQPAAGETQALVEDPRFGGPAVCQGLGDTASICAIASVQ
ncbi:filamentous hemagglutinin N-terminal domain-containing protein [Mesorhizobium sp. AR02]|uniref:MBG domain-containing protein n=1 Tax=Mesorhizobium sp. AR02 TaxID=2865837 RepID=UPI00215F39E0|nr:MBG domain-containing protein [Mesorhizobium sp. AR02]UVK50888.1 filamentous hemagglutinin N-terminal domain-containing protein [Mesorhizobium sp. AR02]